MRRAQNVAARANLYGFSPVEVIDLEGNTGYCELGSGDARGNAARHDCPGFEVMDAIWIAPHSMALHAALDVGAASHRVERMLQNGLLSPLGGPAESAALANSGDVVRYHSVQTALNAFFNAMGYAAAQFQQQGRRHPIYVAGDGDQALRAALGRLWLLREPAGIPGDAGTSDAYDAGTTQTHRTDAASHAPTAKDAEAAEPERDASAVVADASTEASDAGVSMVAVVPSAPTGCSCHVGGHAAPDGKPLWLVYASAMTWILVHLRKRFTRRIRGLADRSA